jgi:hypothetical protein
MPFGCSAMLRSLSHCLQLIRHSSRQLLCPSCHLIHFVLRSAPLHHVRSPPAARHGTLPKTQGNSTSDAHTFPHTHATILPGFHSAPLCPTFISVAFSPPAANNFARLAYHRLRFGASLAHDYGLYFVCHITPLHCVSIRAMPFYCPPHPVALAATFIRTSFQCL